MWDNGSCTATATKEWVEIDKSATNRDKFYEMLEIKQTGQVDEELSLKRCKDTLGWMRDTFGTDFITKEEIRVHGNACSLNFIEPHACNVLKSYAATKLKHRPPQDEEKAQRRQLPTYEGTACKTHMDKSACENERDASQGGFGCTWAWYQGGSTKCQPRPCWGEDFHNGNKICRFGQTSYETGDVIDIQGAVKNNGVWECIPRPNRDAKCDDELCSRGSVHECMMDGLKHGAPENCCAMHKLDGSGEIV